MAGSCRRYWRSDDYELEHNRGVKNHVHFCMWDDGHIGTHDCWDCDAQD